MPNIRRKAALVLGSITGALLFPHVALPCAKPDPAATSKVTKQVNQVRVRAGLPRVRPDRTLRRAAVRHSRRMANSGSIWHDNLSSWSRGRRAAQNVAYGRSGAQSFRAMLRSRRHRGQLMSRSYRLVGVGAARSCDGTVMVTVNLLG